MPTTAEGPARTPAMLDGHGDVPKLQLNDRWRIADDGRLQWILQYRYGEDAAAWRGRRFHVERDALLRSIRELCGAVDPAATAAVAIWPAMHE